ncbi:NUDIX hydrolase [Photobacterium ganghwense]|uniref:NUDIX hydrolase n=1 Tax=Photobacterium ganghwense TaxID=320778 RepID=UPI001C2D0C19|nr:NUDIX domain-containing protein [Photobacterium ganghwense]MBV1839834.1 NUDIX domain-containing protein [Photobacterium ganghwense]
MSKLIDKLAWIIIQDGKLLTVRSKGKTLFYLPGGKREPGESDEQALIREIREELSVELLPDSIRYADTFVGPADGKADDVSVQLTCYFADFSGELKPDAEIEELRYLSSADEAVFSKAAWIAAEWLKEKSLIH